MYFSFSAASFCVTFLSAGIATSISMHVSSFFAFNYYIWPICCNFSECALYSITLSYLHVHVLVCVCVCVRVCRLSVVSMLSALRIE
jgi:hypothetical protein